MPRGEGESEGKMSPADGVERVIDLAHLAHIGRLAASVAHEISTPLASITLRAESLSRNARDPRLHAVDAFKNFPRYLKSIEEEALRCKEILSRLMDFARPPAEEWGPVDLNRLAERAGHLLRHEMMRRRVSLEFHPEPDLPHPEAREGRLGQAILALLLGALDASDEGGTVTLETARHAPEAVTVRVTHQGTGQAADAPEASLLPTVGPGLGLSICRVVASAHGGEIAEERGPARGGRVALVLPLRRPEPPPSTP